MSELILAKETMSKGWILTTIGDISDRIHYGYTETATNVPTGVKFLRISDIQNNSVDWNNVPFCTISEDVISKYLLNENDLVFARTGGTVGKSYLVKNDVTTAVFASYLIRIILNQNIFPKFIHYFFQSDAYWRQIQIGKTGLKTNVNAEILSKIVFPLAPLNEQKRIVTKIEELFSLLDSIKQFLKKTQILLKQYHQSILTSAFTGELTKKWRINNKNKLETAYNLVERIHNERKIILKKKFKEITYDIEDLTELPEGWVWIPLFNIVLQITDGVHKTPKYVKQGVPFLSVNNIDNFGKLIFAGCKLITPEEHELLIKRCKPEKFDILLTKVGTVGRVAIINSENKFSIFVNLALIKPLYNLTNVQFLAYYLKFGFLTGRFKKSVGGSNQQYIGIGSIGELMICLPSIDEQNQIVNELDSSISLIEKLENDIDLRLKNIDLLEIRILKQAFEGTLLPQDPNDEPAEILLEKIKQDRQNIISQTKRGKKNDK